MAYRTQNVMIARLKFAAAMQQFGCTKPGGRPLSEAGMARVGASNVCAVKSKAGKTLYYRKPGPQVTDKDRETREAARQEKQESQLKAKKEGTKGHAAIAARIERTKKRLKVVRERIKREKEEVFRRVDEVSPAVIKVDPERFQYKIMGSMTATGEVGSLSGLRKYDPNLAGILQVWRDPEDGNTYVVNGHNRLALANRLGAEKVAVRFLEVPTAKEARAIGALTNIAEGKGLAIDAAKFFRDTGLTRGDLEDQGIQMKDAIAKNGLALSALPKVLFNRVIDGEFEENIASAIGGTGFDEDKQYRLYEMVKSRQDKGRRVGEDTIKELSDLIKSSTTDRKVTEDLFGEVEEEEDYYFERADLQSMIKRRLAREQRIFGSAARGKETLEKAGNVIDVTKSLGISKAASESLKVFDEFKTTQGSLSDILNKNSKRMKIAATRKERDAIQDETYEEVYKVIPGFLGSLGVKQ